MNLLVVCLWEILKLLHLGDFFLTFLRNFDFRHWFSFTGCDTKTESTEVNEISLSLSLSPLALELVVGRTDLVGSNVLLGSQKVAILLFKLSEEISHLHEELISLPHRGQRINIFLFASEVLLRSLLDLILLFRGVGLADSGLTTLGCEDVVQGQFLFEVTDLSLQLLDQ